MQIRSALEYNWKRKRGDLQHGDLQRPCFGIATDAHPWYFVGYIADEVPKISEGYEAMYVGKFERKKIQKIVGIIQWVLKVALVTSEPQQKS